jgi:hypothetical protein
MDDDRKRARLCRMAGNPEASKDSLVVDRYRAMESLGLHSIAELVQYAVKHRWVSL